MGRVHHAHDIHLQHPRPVGRFEIPIGKTKLARANARRTNDMPDAAEFFLKFCRSRRHAVVISNIAHHIFHVQIRRPFAAAQAAIEHAHARALRGKRRRYRAPNAAAATQHDYALACELEIHARSVNQPAVGRNAR